MVGLGEVDFKEDNGWEIGLLGLAHSLPAQEPMRKG